MLQEIETEETTGFVLTFSSLVTFQLRRGGPSATPMGNDCMFSA